jgi:ABC-2 type transport system permease protein
MRLFSEEINVGSYEILLTMPVTFTDVILGKLLAGVAMVVSMLIPTLAYAITVAFLGELDWGPIIGGYFGAVLMGAAFASIGVFASSLTRNQIIAFIIGMAICLGLTLVDKMLFLFPGSILGVIGYIGADFHFQNVAKGIIDTRDIIYFISVIFIGLYGAQLAMQEKK